MQNPVEVASILPIPTPASSVVAAVSREYRSEFRLTSNDTVLRPDGTELAEFAREAGIILGEIERIARHPRSDHLKLVQEDILNSGVIEGVAKLKELVGDSRDRQFLSDCEYLLMRVVKTEGRSISSDLAALLTEIRRLQLIETARLIEMERGWSHWLASRS